MNNPVDPGVRCLTGTLATFRRAAVAVACMVAPVLLECRHDFNDSENLSEGCAGRRRSRMNRRGINIGLGQARRLCQMAHDERITLLAEGLPIILSSAQNLWRGSRKLGKEMPRESGVLQAFAEEEAAKALIFSGRSAVLKLPHWFKDGEHRRLVLRPFGAAHLCQSRLVEGLPTWAQLREYVDSVRKAHFLEGYVGESILPNWSLYERESQLYADIEAGESGALRWSDSE